MVYGLRKVYAGVVFLGRELCVWVVVQEWRRWVEIQGYGGEGWGGV